MKKTISFIAFASLLFFKSYSQDNKPEANSFGLQYGVNFNGTVGQAVQLSGWLKNGLEVRGSMTFSYTNSQTSTISPQTIYADNNGDRPLTGTYANANSSASITITPTISVVKHFPIKSNLDFFIGGSANCGFTSPTAWTKSSTTQVADSFYSYSATNSKAPLAVNWDCH